MSVLSDSPEESVSTNRLGRAVVNRLRQPGPLGRPRPAPIGSVAAAATRFAIGTGRSRPIRRLLAGPGSVPVHSIRAVDVRPPRWWTPDAAVLRTRADATHSAQAAEPDPAIALGARGLPRAVQKVPDEKSWTPGRITDRMVSTAVPVRRLQEVTAAGPMLTSHDRARLVAPVRARAANVAAGTSAGPATSSSATSPQINPPARRTPGTGTDGSARAPTASVPTSTAVTSARGKHTDGSIQPAQAQGSSSSPARGQPAPGGGPVVPALPPVGGLRSSLVHRLHRTPVRSLAAASARPSVPSPVAGSSVLEPSATGSASGAGSSRTSGASRAEGSHRSLNVRARRSALTEGGSALDFAQTSVSKAEIATVDGSVGSIGSYRRAEAFRPLRRSIGQPHALDPVTRSQTGAAAIPNGPTLAVAVTRRPAGAEAPPANAPTDRRATSGTVDAMTSSTTRRWQSESRDPTGAPPTDAPSTGARPTGAPSTGASPAGDPATSGARSRRPRTRAGFGLAVLRRLTSTRVTPEAISPATRPDHAQVAPTGAGVAGSLRLVSSGGAPTDRNPRSAGSATNPRSAPGESSSAATEISRRAVLSSTPHGSTSHGSTSHGSTSQGSTPTSPSADRVTPRRAMSASDRLSSTAPGRSGPPPLASAADTAGLSAQLQRSKPPTIGRSAPIGRRLESTGDSNTPTIRDARLASAFASFNSIKPAIRTGSGSGSAQPPRLITRPAAVEPSTISRSAATTSDLPTAGRATEVAAQQPAAPARTTVAAGVGVGVGV
ncbi:MAG: hypothetical protein JWM76_3808, partial [Pseudonocardiales bacterium]|nr:hypothetical protein [Pseudonocardiales bacterium]